MRSKIFSFTLIAFVFLQVSPLVEILAGGDENEFATTLPVEEPAEESESDSEPFGEEDGEKEKSELYQRALKAWAEKAWPLLELRYRDGIASDIHGDVFTPPPEVLS